MPRIFGSNVRPDLPDKYGIDGSAAKYDAKAQRQQHAQHGQLQQEQKQQQRNLLLRRKLQQQQQQQFAAASNVDSGPVFEKSADVASNDPRADPDYYDYYSDVDEAAAAAAAAALRRQQLLNQLRKRQGGAGGTHVVNQRPPAAVGGPARATNDYDYGGMTGVGTSASAIGASSGLGGHSGLIDRHGGHSGTGGGYLYLEDECNTGVNPAIALMSLAILAASTFTIVTYVTQNANGKRRRRNLDDDDLDEFAPAGFYLRNAFASSTSLD